MAPNLLADWLTWSNTVVILAVPDEPALEELASRSDLRGYRFHDPDLGDDGELTSFALYPSPEVAGLLGHLPLAGREVIMH